jgi:carboxyl-terminal processing protease
MNTWYKPVLAVLLAAIAAMFLFAAGFWVGRGRSVEIPVFQGGSGGGEGEFEGNGNQIISEAYRRIVSSAVDAPDEAALVKGAIKGMVEVLKKSGDPYALFYGAKSFQEFQELTTGEFSGIGVWLDVKDGDLVVLSVLPNSPALEVDLQPGDVIEAIDGEPVAKMTTDEAVARIKGKSGTDVDLTVDSGGPEQISFSITRAPIEFPNLRAELTKDDIGYINLVGFARGAGKQLHDEVDRLVDDGAEGIVLDIRDNGGGLFSESIDVASVFVEDGVITTYRSPEQEIDYEAKGDAFEDIPVVVLVNGNTASASEIVAGALQDNDRAIVVGSTTFGKGSVQEVIPLSDASALKLTTAAYLTPDGTNINGDGIEPDVEVPGDQPGVQRSRALEILKGIVLSAASQG